MKVALYARSSSDNQRDASIAEPTADLGDSLAALDLVQGVDSLLVAASLVSVCKTYGPRRDSFFKTFPPLS